AIPAPLLERLLERFPRIVFSTTVHGYEGTGRGFTVRFARVLDRRTPGWQQLTLRTPVRWDAGDPLEALVFRALLLDAEPAPDEVFAGALAHAQVERLDRDLLADDEALLREVFGLLVLAHYRTSPLDLRQLLDGPNLSVFALRVGGHVAGVALVVDEGGFPAELAHAVWAGQRRVRGHLLAQSLAQHAGIEHAPRLRGRRIVRIAVHPAVQGRGLGRRLVAAVVEAAQGADYVGSSFGATPALLHFWVRCGFRCVRIGLVRDAASGVPSAMVMRAVSPAGAALLEEARRRFADALPHLLADPLRDLDPAVAAALLADAGPAPDMHGLSSDDWSELEAFARGARDLAYVLAPLHRLTALVFANPGARAALTPKAREALVLKVVEGRSVSETAERLDLAGRRAVTDVLREAVQALIPVVGSGASDW
ncbi:MAG: GNAT family N-acetyltransferase, partial [Thiohalomonadaceae bacterium]